MDITDRIEAERSLKKSQELLAESQKLALLGNWELDLINNHLEWSDEVFEIFELDKEEPPFSYQSFLAAITGNLYLAKKTSRIIRYWLSDSKKSSNLASRLPKQCSNC